MKNDLVVVGASGFGRETLDVIEALEKEDGSVRILGVIDDAPSEANLKRLQERSIPFLGSVDEWAKSSDKRIRFVVGIGAPKIRELISKKLELLGFQTMTLVHPSAVVGSESMLGNGVVVCAGVVVSTNIQIGDYVHLNPGSIIGHDSKLREYVSINPGAVVSGEVEIEPLVLVGAGSTILQGLKVGSGTVVGAGALVTKNVPSSVVVTGIPGRWDTK